MTVGAPQPSPCCHNSLSERLGGIGGTEQQRVSLQQPHQLPPPLPPTGTMTVTNASQHNACKALPSAVRARHCWQPSERYANGEQHNEPPTIDALTRLLNTHGRKKWGASMHRCHDCTLSHSVNAQAPRLSSQPPHNMQLEPQQIRSCRPHTNVCRAYTTSQHSCVVCAGVACRHTRVATPNLAKVAAPPICTRPPQACTACTQMSNVKTDQQLTVQRHIIQLHRHTRTP